MSIKRRVIRAGGWGLIKRIIKPVPVIGSLFALALAGYEIRRKGLLPGAIHVGLDVTPVLGTAKNVLEIFTGDLIPDRANTNGNHGSGSLPMNKPITQFYPVEIGGRAVKGNAVS